MKIKTTQRILEENKIHRDFYDNMESLSEQRRNHKWVAVKDVIAVLYDNKTLHSDADRLVKIHDALTNDSSPPTAPRPDGDTNSR